MILDQIKNAALYRGLHPHIQAGLDYLSKFNGGGFTTGRDDVQGDSVFALKQEYLTKPPEDGMWESHRRYADIQFIVEGEEQMGYAPVDSLTVTKPYDESGDAALYKGDGQFLSLRSGWFAIFFPEDAHMPCRSLSTPSSVRKIVVKVKL